MTEEWRPIAGFEGFYEVSSFGRVRSLRRKAGGLRDDRPLQPSPDHKGYPQVSLFRGGARASRRIHRLVLETFVGKRPEGFTASHLDGDSGNPRLDNLTWESMADNHRRKKDHGTEHIGERAPCAKLRDPQVVAIRARFAAGEKKKALARAFGVTPRTIRDLLAGKTWSHIP